MVRTPSMFRQMGICDEEYWVVHHALYGLTTSPRSWSVFRDETLKNLELVVQGRKARISPLASDPNVWEVCSEEGDRVALLAIYVDDLLCIGSTAAVKEVLGALGKVWKCTEPILVRRYRQLQWV